MFNRPLSNSACSTSIVARETDRLLPPCELTSHADDVTKTDSDKIGKPDRLTTWRYPQVFYLPFLDEKDKANIAQLNKTMHDEVDKCAYRYQLASGKIIQENRKNLSKKIYKRKDLLAKKEAIESSASTRVANWCADQQPRGDVRFMSAMLIFIGISLSIAAFTARPMKDEDEISALAIWISLGSIATLLGTCLLAYSCRSRLFSQVIENRKKLALNEIDEEIAELPDPKNIMNV